MTSPTYGITFVVSDDDPRPSQPSDLSVVGLVLPSDDANVTAFPLNTPVVFDSGDPTILPLLGTGPLAKAVLAIDDQLADLQTSARCVAVRVATAFQQDDVTEDIDGTIANIVGDRASATGMYALLNAGNLLGVIPRLLCFNGYTGHTRTAVSAMTISAAGSGYTTAPTVTFSPSSGTGVVSATAHVTVSAGGLATVVIDSPGAYPLGTTVTATVSGGGGTGGTLHVTTAQIGNPICAAVTSVNAELLAHAVVGGPGTSEQDAINWMGFLSDSSLIPVDNWNIVAAGEGTAYEDGAARVVGLGVRSDFKNAGFPFNSFVGQVQNILGLKNYWTFSLTDGATQGQELMAAHIGVTERGEIGVETAVNVTGFQFIGVFNASSDPVWWFYNKTRTRDFIHLSLLKSIRLRLGVDNVTPHSVQAVLNDMQVVLNQVMANGGSVGFRVGFEAATNSPSDLRQGKFRVFFNSEAPAPIINVTVDSRPYYDALTAELNTIVAQAATLSPTFIGA